MLVRQQIFLVALFIFLLGSVTSAVAEDHYYSIDVGELKFVEGKLPARPGEGWTRGVDWRRVEAMHPRAVLETSGETYIQGFEDHWIRSQPRDNARLLVHTTVAKDVTGWLYWPKTDYSGYVKLKFILSQDLASVELRKTFLQARLAHYQELFQRGVTGSAWYRHQVLQTANKLDQSAPDLQNNRRFFGNRGNDVTDTYALFSGGRALSENLQLDRQLATSKEAEANIALASIEGITVEEFDWEPAIKGLNPERDILAAHIPADQHVIFFPSFKALVTLADEMAEQGGPLLTMAEPRGETALVQERYEQQLGLSLDAGVRLLGPTMIKSVALTGSDPYLRTGADVAVLLEAKSAVVVRKFIDTQVATRGQQYESAKVVEGELVGVAYKGMRSPDRVICSYVATLGKTVVITNSLAQLQRLVETHQGTRTALGKLSEYTFFRQRYPLGDGQETALMLISDNTIRRWCGPRWRIGSSRRTRAAASMADIQASQLDALVAGEEGHPAIAAPLMDVGELSMVDNGVFSPVYGTLDFQTPIVELEMEQVTQEEARLYGRWRDSYQRYWSNVFDPIAVRFHVTDSKIATDVTVMPLIDNSDYREWIAVSKGVELAADFGDQHPDSILHWALALNAKSPMLQQGTGLIRLFAPQIKVNPLSWLGKGVSVFVDEDPFWEELITFVKGFKGSPEDALEEFFPTRFHRLPVALHVDVQSGFKLTLFLAGVRAFLESTGPGMLNWETLEHEGQPYVKVSATAEGRRTAGDLSNDLAVYYAATGDSLILTLSQSLLQRALARRSAPGKAPVADKASPDQISWLGKSMGLQVKPRVLKLMESGLTEEYRENMRRLSWANLVILNEWKKRYPKEDPVALHARFWQRQLICPGGGKYVWNEEWQTMESTVFGHPAKSKVGVGFPDQLKQLKLGNFGVTFEESGLRARLELNR